MVSLNQLQCKYYVQGGRGKCSWANWYGYQLLVIASEAKQSRKILRKNGLLRRASALLVMTGVNKFGTTTRLIATQVLRTGGKCILANWYDYQLLVIAGVNVVWLVDKTTSLSSLRGWGKCSWAGWYGY